VIDENYMNYALLHDFLNSETFSLTESLISWWPENFLGGATMIRPIMSSGLWSFFFPKLEGLDKDT
jgi:hypothetical protein